MAQEIRMALLRDKVRELEEVLASRDKALRAKKEEFIPQQLANWTVDNLVQDPRVRR